jgi:hypothetical protein
MSVTYYVALPFVRTEDGVAPGEAQPAGSGMCAAFAVLHHRAGSSSSPNKLWLISATTMFVKISLAWIVSSPT